MFGFVKHMFAQKPAPASPEAVSLPAMKSLWTPQTVLNLAQQLMIMPDPDAILRKAGIRRSTLDKLLFDDEIYQAVSTRLDGLRIVPVRLEPTETKESVFIQERCLAPEFLKIMVEGAFSARLFGYSVMEVIWDREAYERERVFVPQDISRQNLDFFSVRPEGLLVQRADGGGVNKVFIDPVWQKKLEGFPEAGSTYIVMDTDYKFLLTRNNPTWENPYGEALLSRLWWPWFFRQKAWSFYGQYLERYAIPMLVGSGENTAEIAEALIKAHQNSVCAVKTDDKVAALNVNSAGHELYASAENMLVRRIEKVILGQTLTSGTDGGSGNRALGDVHNAVREDKIKSDIELVRPTIQHFVEACFKLNGFRGEVPEVVFGDDRQLAEDRAKRDAILIQHNIVKGFSKDYLMDNYGFRPGEFVMPDPTPPPPFPLQDSNGQKLQPEDEAPDEGRETDPEARRQARASAGGHKFALAKAHKRDFEIEALALWGARKAPQPLDPEEIRAAIAESESARELMDRLAKLKTNPDFAAALLETQEAAYAMGGADHKKNV
jgi:hypothetical protein